MENFHEYRSVWEHGELMERLRRIRHVALDMDGTIYVGMSLFPYTQAFLRGLREQGIGYSFLTNNPSKCIDDYLHKLAKLGIKATRDEMYTTALATIDYIKARYPAARRLFLLGTPSMISEFEAAGFESCAGLADDVPELYPQLREAVVLDVELAELEALASEGADHADAGEVFLHHGGELALGLVGEMAALDAGARANPLVARLNAVAGEHGREFPVGDDALRKRAARA